MVQQGQYGRLEFEGHTFSVNCRKKDHTVWRCSGRSFDLRGARCNASVTTRIIDGYERIHVNQANHICHSETNGTQNNENDSNNTSQT